MPLATVGIALVAIAGSGLVFQNGMNSTLGKITGSTSFASLVSFGSGSVLMVTYLIVQTYGLGTDLPTIGAMKGACALPTVHHPSGSCNCLTSFLISHRPKQKRGDDLAGWLRLDGWV
jgi:hypothetical protein